MCVCVCAIRVWQAAVQLTSPRRIDNIVSAHFASIEAYSFRYDSCDRYVSVRPYVDMNLPSFEVPHKLPYFL